VTLRQQADSRPPALRPPAPGSPPAPTNPLSPTPTPTARPPTEYLGRSVVSGVTWW
jgi:hypothetical protein